MAEWGSSLAGRRRPELGAASLPRKNVLMDTDEEETDSGPPQQYFAPRKNGTEARLPQSEGQYNARRRMREGPTPANRETNLPSFLHSFFPSFFIIF